MISWYSRGWGSEAGRGAGEGGVRGAVPAEESWKAIGEIAAHTEKEAELSSKEKKT